MVVKVFGNILAKRRKESGYTQEKLAELSGYDRTYISLLERGLRQPTITTIFNLSKALKLNAHQLIKEVEEAL